MIVREKNETRSQYLMRVAAMYIEEHCPDQIIEYDGTECDGSCIVDDLNVERIKMKGVHNEDDK